MARPKTGKPPKKNLTLTVDEQTRDQLDLLSQHRQMSISSMVAEWVDQEVQQLNQEVGRQALNQKYMDAIKATIDSGKADEILQSPKVQALENSLSNQEGQE